jgi:hypothetical protein
MAIEYRFTLAGDTPAAEVAARAVADPTDRPTPTASGRVLRANLFDRLGYHLTVVPGRDAYHEAEGDPGEGPWEWELAAHISVTFRMDKDPDRWVSGVRNMLEAVARLLASGGEDAALILNGDRLLLTRTGGVVRKHRRATWWAVYDGADEIIPG